MKNIVQIIEESAIYYSMRKDLSNLANKFLALKDEEEDAIAEMHKCKSGINERQYEKRLREPMSQEKRDQIVSYQYAWRSLHVNSVLRIHEARLGLVSLAASIKANMVKLGPQTEPSSVRALVALNAMLRATQFKDADSILKELDSVSGIDRKRLFEAVQIIFRAKKNKKGLLGLHTQTTRLLRFDNPAWWVEALDEGAKSAMQSRAEMEKRWDEFTTARSKCNIRQFTQRTEEAWAAGDNDKVETIRQERINAEARLFVAASHYADGTKLVATSDDALQAAFDKAASIVDDTDLSLDNVKLMSHALGAWFWLGELRNYILVKFNTYNIPGLIEDLAFDADLYLTA